MNCRGRLHKKVANMCNILENSLQRCNDLPHMLVNKMYFLVKTIDLLRGGHDG